jgi:hypothetical protein
MNFQELLDQMKQLHEDFLAALEALQEGETLEHELSESPEEEAAEGIDMGIPGPVSLDGYEAEQNATKQLARPYGTLGKGFCITIKMGE